MARIGIFGAGGVGLVTGACFAELGHEVVIRDVVPEKIDGLRRGEVPFHEERVPELLERNSERMPYTLDSGRVAGCELLSVCVDTPPTSSAKMIKLAANAFLMTRISFINEIANVCEATGADVVKVAEGVGLDHRLGPHFLRAGIGYGGSCLHPRESISVLDRGRMTLQELF